MSSRGSHFTRFAAAALLAGSLAAAGAAPPEARGIPEVSLDYFALFDNTCADLAKQAPDAVAVQEMQGRLGSFRAFWAKDGPPLLRAAVAVTGVPFRFLETRAALATCGFPSLSLPLLINMRPYLAATAKEGAAPLTDFSNTVFHEVLHRYVGDAIEALPGRTTPLLRKYAAEPPVVRNHLHLYAIERLAYRRLGREKELESVIALENTFRSAALFQRGRSIVAEEDPQAFVKELSGAAAP